MEDRELRLPPGVGVWQLHTLASWMLDEHGQMTLAGWGYVSRQLEAAVAVSRRWSWVVGTAVAVAVIGAGVAMFAPSWSWLLLVFQVLAWAAAFVAFTSGRRLRRQTTRVEDLVAALQVWGQLPEERRQQHLTAALPDPVMDH